MIVGGNSNWQKQKKNLCQSSNRRQHIQIRGKEAKKIKEVEYIGYMQIQHKIMCAHKHKLSLFRVKKKLN